MSVGFNGIRESLNIDQAFFRWFIVPVLQIYRDILSSRNLLIVLNKTGSTVKTSCICFMLILVSPTAAVAGPWVAPGDSHLRHHIQILANAGIIRSPVTAWPLMWASIERDLDYNRGLHFPQSILWSLNYVRFELNQQTKSSRQTYHLGVRSDANVFTDFGSTVREKAELAFEHGWIGDWWALNLDFGAVDEPFVEKDDKTFRADGSYAAALFGNWSISLGSIDHWWGPGWETSLILSTNARPVPAITVQRNIDYPFQSGWLSWLGPWHLTTFVGQMESDRAVPDAKLFGMRVGIRPHPNVEIALSRTAQWGGKDRPQDLSSFWKVLIGNDNIEGVFESNADGEATRVITDEDRAKDPANQLAGIDINFSWGDQLLSNIYVQAIGEDESNFAPAKKVYLLGAQTVALTDNAQHRFILEGFDTAVDSLFSGNTIYDTAYRHSVYLSGNTFQGRTLGAWSDNDSRVFTVSGLHIFSSQSIEWKAQRIELNRDASDGDNEQHLLTPVALDFNRFVVRYSHFWRFIKLSFDLSYLSEKLLVNGQEIGNTVGEVGVTYRF